MWKSKKFSNIFALRDFLYYIFIFRSVIFYCTSFIFEFINENLNKCEKVKISFCSKIVRG